MNKQLHARKRRQFKSLCKQLNHLMQGEHKEASKQKIEAIILKIKHLLRELSGIIARWEMKKILGAAAVIFGLTTTSVQGQYFAEPVLNPFGLSSSAFNIPVLADLDGDGDMDLLSYQSGQLKLLYRENIGTVSEPSFGAAQAGPFGLDIESSGAWMFPAVADLDGDGDLDVFVVTYNTGQTVTYYENIGTPSVPQFMVQGGILFDTSSLNDAFYVAPAFGDMDSDGDFDLIAGITNFYDDTDNFRYFENSGVASQPEFVPLESNDLGLFFLLPNTYAYLTMPAAADLDMDGDTDIICGISGNYYTGDNQYDHGIFYFENIGSGTSPLFQISERNPLGIINPLANDTFLTPTLADLDNDGDVDMLCASPNGNFFYYENILNATNTTTPHADFSANISPNPTNNYLNINTEESLTQIEIYDLTGRQLATYSGQQTLISIQDLNSGTYMIRLINQQGESLSKRIEKL